MKLRTKILLSLSVIVLVCLASLVAGFLYLYYTPSAVKPFIEKTISGSTGTSFTIETLSYSFKPFHVRANGILFRSDDVPSGFTLTIPDLIADLDLKGPFGRKTLYLTNLKIDGFSFLLAEKAQLPQIKSKGKRPSFYLKILKDIFGLFLLKDIKFQGAEMKRGEITAHWKDQVLEVREMRGILRNNGPLEIVCSANLKGPAAEMNLVAPHLQIITDSSIDFDEPVLKGTLSAPRATLLSPQAHIQSLDIKTKFNYTHKQQSLTLESLDLFLRELQLKYKNDGLKPFNLLLNAEGLIYLDKRRLNSSRFRVEINDALRLNGQLNALLGSKKNFQLKILDGSILPLKLLPLLPERFKEKWSPVTLSGPLSLIGQIDGQNGSGKWILHSDLGTKFEDNPFTYSTETFQFKSLLTGMVQAKGGLTDLDVRLEMKGYQTSISHNSIKPVPFTWDLSMSGRHPSYLINRLKADIPAVKANLGVKEIPFEGIQIQIREGHVNGDKRSLSIPKIKLQSALLKNIEASIEADGKKVVLELEGDDTQIIDAAHGLDLVPKGWKVKGRDSIQASVILDEQGDMSYDSKFGFTAVDFQNRDGSVIGEKITTIGVVKGTLDPTHSIFNANSTVRITGGEILYDRFYFDLNKNSLVSNLIGNFDISKKSLHLSKADLHLKNLLTLEAKGTIVQKEGEPEIQFSLNIPKTRLEPVFHHFFVEPFKPQKPFLTSLELGGSFSVNTAVTKTEPSRLVMGHLFWHEGELAYKKDGIRIKGIDLDLPLWYSTRDLKAGAKEIMGALSVQSMTLPLLPEQPLNLTLEAGPNRLSVTSPTVLQSDGGEIRMSPLTFSDLPSSDPAIETGLTLKNVDLNPFLSKIWSNTIQGTLNGTLAPVRYSRNILSSKGELKADAFGGDIVLSDLEASDLFSSTPLFKLNARINDLHLDMLTRDTSFGRIEGILEGHVQDLEIAHRQPQKFDLLLETVKKKGINQRISIAAVDNIARIGGGQSPFMGFAGVMTSFFKEFPYKKIGVRATLDNDIFKIRGTIKEEGKEFLVKRGGLSGVNVINQNPDNRIRFQDMVKRVKRISAGKGGPVIK